MIPVDELAIPLVDDAFVVVEPTVVAVVEPSTVVDAVVPGAPPVPIPGWTQTSETHRSGSAQSSVA